MVKQHCLKGGTPSKAVGSPQKSMGETVIDKSSSLSCQKVAYSITSPKIGGKAAK